MAYPYFPTTYNPITYPFYQSTTVPQPAPQPQAQPTQTSSGVVWVQGEAAAKAYPVAPNTTVLLMDSEGDRFFLKSADGSGVPLPLRIFEYREIKTGAVPVQAEVKDAPEYATKKELDEVRRRLDSIAAKKAVKENE